MSTQPWFKYYPQGALEDLGVTGRRLQDLLADAIKKFGDRPALTAGSTTWTFQRLGTESQRLADLFSAAGVSDGERVAILLPNMPEYVAALFGTWLSGGTVAQVNSAYVASEIERVVANSLPSVLVTTGDQLRKLREHGYRVAIPVCLIDAREGATLIPGESLGTRSAPANRPDQSSDVAVLQYSGGTTGLPKAVMLTHENLLSNIEQRLRVTLRNTGAPAGARAVNVLPMCHIYGLTCVTLSSIAAGL
jgi:long-chain acyl-CoA synthetase